VNINTDRKSQLVVKTKKIIELKRKLLLLELLAAVILPLM